MTWERSQVRQEENSQFSWWTNKRSNTEYLNSRRTWSLNLKIMTGICTVTQSVTQFVQNTKIKTVFYVLLPSPVQQNGSVSFCPVSSLPFFCSPDFHLSTSAKKKVEIWLLCAAQLKITSMQKEKGVTMSPSYSAPGKWFVQNMDCVVVTSPPSMLQSCVQIPQGSFEKTSLHLSCLVPCKSLWTKASVKCKYFRFLLQHMRQNIQRNFNCMMSITNIFWAPGLVVWLPLSVSGRDTEPLKPEVVYYQLLILSFHQTCPVFQFEEYKEEYSP